MSEQNPSTHSQKTRNKIAGTALVALLASSTGAVGGYSLANHNNGEQKAQELQRTIVEVREEQKMAEAMAGSYGKDLRNNTPVPTKVLNGDVVLAANNGFPEMAYKNPIALFGIENPHMKSDANGGFLENKWFGIRVTRTDGQLDIMPVQFLHEKGMSFKANDPNDVVFNANVMPQWPIKGGPDSAVLGAFDIITNQPLYNPDGTPLIPGDFDGMK